jgi:TatD DNase family protein
MQLVDIAVNLTHDAFAADREAIIARARAAGVAQLVATGTEVAESRAAAELAAAHPGQVYATAGVHPHHARDWSDAAAEALGALAARPEVVAIGEAGLDFNRNYSPPGDQEHAFAAQLELAAVLGRPMLLHARDAHPRFAEQVAAWRDRLPGAVLHCFTGDAEELAAVLDLDLHVGITGWICDERRGLHLRELVRRIPGDRLLVETDAPFLLPRDLRPKPKGGRNEPAFLPHVVRAVAAALDRDPYEVARETTANARRLFGLVER